MLAVCKLGVCLRLVFVNSKLGLQMSTKNMHPIIPWGKAVLSKCKRVCVKAIANGNAVRNGKLTEQVHNVNRLAWAASGYANICKQRALCNGCFPWATGQLSRNYFEWKNNDIFSAPQFASRPGERKNTRGTWEVGGGIVLSLHIKPECWHDEELHMLKSQVARGSLISGPRYLKKLLILNGLDSNNSVVASMCEPHPLLDTNDTTMSTMSSKWHEI